MIGLYLADLIDVSELTSYKAFTRRVCCVLWIIVGQTNITHWGLLHEMAAILQTTFSNWFGWGFGVEKSTRFYLHQCWPSLSTSYDVIRSQGVQFSLISTHCALLTPYGGMGFSQSGSSIYLLTDDSIRQLPSPKLTYRESGTRDYITINFSWIYLSSCETVVIILFRYNPSSEPTSLYRILSFGWNLHFSQSPSPPPLWKFSFRITELHKSNYGSP